MYGTKLKKFQGCVLHTANEDDDGSKDDATTLPEDGVVGPKDDNSGSDDDGGQDNRGVASEDSDDEIEHEPFGTHAVQLLAIRANYRINAIIAFDWTIGRCIYSVREGEVQEEGMVDLVLIGPSQILEAYGCLTFKVCTDDDELVAGWGVPADKEEVEAYTETIVDDYNDCKLEITYLVIPYAIETHVEVRLKLKDLGLRSRAVYGRIRASIIEYGNKRVHLFGRQRGSRLSFPSGSTSILPLTPSVIALVYRPRFKLYIEVDLRVIITCDSQEEDKNLKFCLDFTRRFTTQEIEVDGDQVEVNVIWYLEAQI